MFLAWAPAGTKFFIYKVNIALRSSQMSFQKDNMLETLYDVVQNHPASEVP